jgi:hypothetical protein
MKNFPLNLKIKTLIMQYIIVVLLLILTVVQSLNPLPTGGYREQDMNKFDIDVRITSRMQEYGLLEHEHITRVYTQLVYGLNYKIFYDEDQCFKFYCPFNREMPCSVPTICE